MALILCGCAVAMAIDERGNEGREEREESGGKTGRGDFAGDIKAVERLA